MVVTSRPSARNAGVMQLCTGIAVQPHRARTAIACVATLLDAVGTQRPDEGAQALAGIGLGVERLTVHRVRHGRAPMLSSVRISSA